MSFPLVNPLSWAYLEILTSAQMNTLDIDHSHAVDKRAGHLEIDAQDFDIWADLDPYFISGNWTSDFDYPWQSTVGGAGTGLEARFNLPRGWGTLKSVTTYMSGTYKNPGAHVGFPDLMPHFALQLVRVGTPGGFLAALQSVTGVPNGVWEDGGTNFGNVLGNYDGFWSATMSNGGTGFGATDLTHGAATPYHLRLLVVGEENVGGGTNARTGLTITGIKTTWNCTKMRPG